MVSKAQERANKKWRKDHRKRSYFLNDRSSAKRYIRNETSITRLEALIALIKSRIQDLK